MIQRCAGLTVVAVLVALIAVGVVSPALAQVQEGATMTVLRGEVAVIRTDGSAIQPAPSGTIIGTGDEIRTLTRTGALITFFAGTEIELGENTILVVDRVARQGATIDIALKQVLGVTVNRVQALTDPGSSYRIDAGGATALVRGTTFALIGPAPTSQGNVVALVCLDDCDGRTSFNGCAVSPYTAFGTVVEHGKATSGCDVASVGRGSDYFDAAFESVTTFEQSFAQGNGQNNPGQANLGREQGTSHSDQRAQDAQQDDQPSNLVASPSPGPTGPTGPTGTLSGVIANARTGQPLGGATVQVLGTTLSASTGSDGSFLLVGVPTGAQTLQVSAPGFVTATRAVTVVAGANPTVAIALVPSSSAGDITIVLTWGAQPSDLDSHLSGPDRSSGRFQVAYFSPRQPQPNPYAVLDVDDTSSFGPETITISRDPTTGQFVPGEYRYWVHNFSGAPGFNVSNAQVTISKGGAQLAAFDVANASGDPSLAVWRVANLTVDASGNVSIAPIQAFSTGSQNSIFAIPDDSSPAPAKK